jgi:hypothetical protein
MELGIDRDENILGVPYNLPTSDEFQAIIHRVGLRVELRRGLQYFAPYFHVFAPSTAFLDHASLPPPTRNVSTSSGFDELCGLEDLAAERLPVDMAGWIQYILTLAE